MRHVSRHLMHSFLNGGSCMVEFIHSPMPANTTLVVNTERPSLNTIRHTNYYFPSGDIVILCQDRLFKVSLSGSINSFR